MAAGDAPVEPAGRQAPDLFAGMSTLWDRFPGEPDHCEHDSATGVDQAPFGPDKVWRCDECGWLYRSVPIDGSLTMTVPAASHPSPSSPCIPNTTGDGNG